MDTGGQVLLMASDGSQAHGWVDASSLGAMPSLGLIVSSGLGVSMPTGWGQSSSPGLLPSTPELPARSSHRCSPP